MDFVLSKHIHFRNKMEKISQMKDINILLILIDRSTKVI
jgi:hypothetical protein